MGLGGGPKVMDVKDALEYLQQQCCDIKGPDLYGYYL